MTDRRRCVEDREEDTEMTGERRGERVETDERRREKGERRKERGKGQKYRDVEM